MDLTSRVQRILVDIIWEPSNIGGFPGLYEPHITLQSFVIVDKKSFLVTSSYWGSRSTLLMVSLDNREVR